MKLPKSCVFITSFVFLYFFLFVAPFAVYAEDNCPSIDGQITEDTVWTEGYMTHGVYDCSQTDLVIDGAVLTIQLSDLEQEVDSVMDVKSITFRNDGDFKVQIVEPPLLTKQIRKVVNTLSDPYSVGEIAVGAGVGLQVMSLVSIFLMEKLGWASAFGIVSQAFLGGTVRKHLWGIAYNSKNGKPVAFAVIRLFDVRTRQLIATTVTDLDGRYGFPVAPGSYFLDVSHEEYFFPPKTSPGAFVSDSKKNYTGGEFRVEQETGVDFSIPLEPRDFKFGPNREFFSFMWSKLKSFVLAGNTYLLILLCFLNFILMVVKFNMFNLIFGFVYAILLILKIIAKGKKPRTWGLVYNSKTTIPVPAAFVKLYEGETRRLVDTKLADIKGRFQFFVPKGRYLTLVAAPGYQFPSEKISREELAFYEGLLRVDSREGVIDLEIPIDPVAKVGVSPFGA